MFRRIKDKTSQKFGKLLVLKLAGRNPQGAIWECLCDCGNRTFVRTSNLNKNGTGARSCGCSRKVYHGNLLDRRFGRLLVISKTKKRNNNGSIVWECQCDCGKKVMVPTSELRRLKCPARSCGCLKKDILKEKRGNKNYNWNPKLTNTEREQGRFFEGYAEWRILVFERDKYICSICGEKGGILNAHHLEGYKNNPNKRVKLSNGITLCNYCHKKFHHIYGNKNNTQEQFNGFLKEKLCPPRSRTLSQRMT